MSIGRIYEFRAVTPEALGLLESWQSRPHVRQWWGRDAPYNEQDLCDRRVSRWIVWTRDQPFAFMQDYTVHGWPDHHFAHLPKGSRGIDQFIGDPAMIGIGHGTAFVGARIKTLFEGGAPVVATDPHPDNARAIAVYKKLGFRALEAPLDTKWGAILPMQVTRGW